MEDNNAPEVPMPCTAGCGFYGNKIYNNMCSKCFREQAEKKKVLETGKASLIDQDKSTPTDRNDTSLEATPAKDTITQADSSHNQESAKPVQLNKGRCFACKSKVPLTKQVTNKCRCDYVFCDNHRYPDSHDCQFDHASMDKDILTKRNPKLNERPRGGRSFQRLDSL